MSDTESVYLQQTTCFFIFIMARTNIIHVQRLKTPCGELILYAYKERLCMCDWATSFDQRSTSLMLRQRLKAEFEESPSPVLREAVKQLKAYFRRRSMVLKVPLLLVGTDFQKKVWKALLDIPYGKTSTYGEIARRLGKENGARAVARACHDNILDLFLPCHRVVGKGAGLCGYAGGKAVKQWLLDLEEQTLCLPEALPEPPAEE